MGGEATRFPITKDDLDLICKQVEDAAQDHDLILLNAGSSAGAEDFSAKVVEKLGQPARSWGGRAAGTSGDFWDCGVRQLTVPTVHRLSSPIIGVPGYPVSAALTIDIFVEPLLAKWLGRRPAELSARAGATHPEDHITRGRRGLRPCCGWQGRRQAHCSPAFARRRRHHFTGASGWDCHPAAGCAGR